MTDARVLAGRATRLLATGVDAVLVPCLTLVLVMMTGVVEDAEDYLDAWWTLHVFLLAVFSYLLLNGLTLLKRGQTLGKVMLGIAIVEVGADAPPSLWRLIFVRALFFPMLFLLVPPLILIPLADQLLIFRRARRCIHDYAAGTEVIRYSKRRRS
jgi:uncharacterized RDD family membrane protein YckC